MIYQKAGFLSGINKQGYIETGKPVSKETSIKEK